MLRCDFGEGGNPAAAGDPLDHVQNFEPKPNPLKFLGTLLVEKPPISESSVIA